MAPDLSHAALPTVVQPGPVLAVRGLGVGIRIDGRTIRAIDDVSLDLWPGETLGLVGESGSGKTMTALALMRLVESPPVVIDRGTAMLRDQDLLTLPERAMEDLRGSAIAMVFQEPMTALNPVLTIGHQVAEPLRRHRHLPRAQARARTLDLLAQVGLPDPVRTARLFPHELSGGMRQRATIAIAIACNPAVLVADEPTTALDVTVQAQILDLLRSLQRELGMAMLLITHDLGVVAEVADRVAVMYAGRVVETAAVADLFRSPAHPYTRGLLRSIPQIARARPAVLPEIAGVVPSLLAMPPGCAFAARCDRAVPRCMTDRPDLVPLTHGHAVACWRPIEAAPDHG